MMNNYNEDVHYSLENSNQSQLEGHNTVSAQQAVDAYNRELKSQYDACFMGFDSARMKGGHSQPVECENSHLDLQTSTASTATTSPASLQERAAAAAAAGAAGGLRHYESEDLSESMERENLDRSHTASMRMPTAGMKLAPHSHLTTYFQPSPTAAAAAAVSAATAGYSLWSGVSNPSENHAVGMRGGSCGGGGGGGSGGGSTYGMGYQPCNCSYCVSYYSWYGAPPNYYPSPPSPNSAAAVNPMNPYYSYMPISAAAYPGHIPHNNYNHAAAPAQLNVADPSSFPTHRHSFPVNYGPMMSYSGSTVQMPQQMDYYTATTDGGMQNYLCGPIPTMQPPQPAMPSYEANSNAMMQNSAEYKMAYYTPVYVNRPVPNNTEHFQRKKPTRFREAMQVGWINLYLEVEKQVEEPTRNARIAWMNDMHQIVYTKLTSGVYNRWQYEMEFDMLRTLINSKCSEADNLFNTYRFICKCGERFNDREVLTGHGSKCDEYINRGHRCLCSKLMPTHEQFFCHIFNGDLLCPMAIYHLWIYLEKYRKRRYKCACGENFCNFWVFYVHLGECREYRRYFVRHCTFCANQRSSMASCDDVDHGIWPSMLQGPLKSLVYQSKIQ